MANGLVLLSEGFCPMGHGPLTGKRRNRCDECDAKWRLDSLSFGQTVTAERRVGETIYGSNELFWPAQLKQARFPDEMVGWTIERLFARLPSS